MATKIKKYIKVLVDVKTNETLEVEMSPKETLEYEATLAAYVPLTSAE